MKKILYIILPIAMLVTFNSCDWANATFFGKPTKAELAKKAQIENARQDSITQAQAVEAMERDRQQLEQRIAENKTSDAMDNNRYHVVVGCFKVPANADRMIKVLKDNGYSPQLIHFKNGYTCISAASFADVKTAYNKMYAILKSDFCPEDVWVYDSKDNLHKTN